MGARHHGCLLIFDIMGNSLVSGTPGRKVDIKTTIIGSVEAYEVTKRELLDIEKGESGKSFWSGLGGFFLSAGISFLTTYLTLDETDTKKGGIILTVFITSFVIGIFSYIKVLHCENELKGLFNDIRNRK